MSWPGVGVEQLQWVRQLPAHRLTSLPTRHAGGSCSLPSNLHPRPWKRKAHQKAQQVLAAALVAVQVGGAGAHPQPQLVKAGALHARRAELCNIAQRGLRKKNVERGRRLATRYDQGRRCQVAAAMHASKRVAGGRAGGRAKKAGGQRSGQASEQAAQRSVPTATQPRQPWRNHAPPPVVSTSVRALPGGGCGGASAPCSLLPGVGEWGPWGAWEGREQHEHEHQLQAPGAWCKCCGWSSFATWDRARAVAAGQPTNQPVVPPDGLGIISRFWVAQVVVKRACRGAQAEGWRWCTHAA